MKFSFSDEQEEFRTTLRRFLEDTSPSAAVRQLMASDVGYSTEVWRQLSADLGLTGIHIPEAYGGQGFGISELSIAVEEMGRALLCAPYFASCVMAATAIAKGGRDEQKRALLPGIASGTTIATLAVAEDSGRWDADGITMTAQARTKDGAGAANDTGTYQLHGAKNYVVDGHIAELIVVAARSPRGEANDGGGDDISLFTVAGDAAGLTRQQLTSADATRKIARLSFDGVDAQLLGTLGDAGPALRDTLDVAAICLAGEMVGGAQRLLEDAIDYAKMRVQFGRPIASFQTLKHKAADMLLDVELAKSAAYYAAAAVDDGDSDVAALASLAKAAASDAYMQTAVHAIQIHGGIGFTWDNDTHLWFKRAKSSEVFLGGAAYHRERLMQQWNV